MDIIDYYKRLINFSNALDSYILKTNVFFDYGLLNIINMHLGYSNSAINSYDENKAFSTGVSYNLPIGLQQEYLSYHKVDPFSKYISANFEELEKNGVKVIFSSHVFAEDYDNCEYCKFLNSFGGLSYAATIPFDNIRLSIYKNSIQGDFSQDEVVFLNELEKVLRSKFTLHSKITKPERKYTLDELKNRLFDDMSTGVFVLNKCFEILDCNNTAKIHHKALSHGQSISSYFSSLIPLLQISVADNSKEACTEERVLMLNGYIIKFRLYYNPESEMSNDKIIYFITTSVANDGHSDIRSKPYPHDSLKDDFAAKYDLSPREMEVIEAIANGNKYQEVAEQLFISVNTVRTHIKNIYRKLDITNQRNLLYIYNEHARQNIL